MPEIEITVRINVYAVAAVCAGLALFGVWYDHAVGRMERRREDRGYTAFLVVFGTLVTMTGYMLVLASSALIVTLFACFAASGLPMVVGSVRRHQVERAREEAAVRELVRGTLGDE